MTDHRPEDLKLPVQDVEKWVRELEAAGWTRVHNTLWQAPCGCHFRGPYMAWHCMTMDHVGLHQQSDRILASEIRHG